MPAVRAHGLPAVGVLGWRQVRRGLLAAAAASAMACSSGPAPPPLTPAAAPPEPGFEALRTGLTRLEAGLASRPAVAPSSRNPFRFGGGRHATNGHSEAPPLPPAEGLPTVPLPLAQPPLRLLGIVTLIDGALIASINVGGDLVLARTGDVLAGRFTVTRIDRDAVELTDAVGDRPLRLALP